MWSCLKLAALSSNTFTVFDFYIWYFVVETLNMQYCIQQLSHGGSWLCNCPQMLPSQLFDLGQVKTLRFLDTLNIYCSKACLIFFSLSRSFHILETMQRAWLLLLLGCLKIASGFKVGIWDLQDFIICSYFCQHLNIATTWFMFLKDFRTISAYILALVIVIFFCPSLCLLNVYSWRLWGAHIVRTKEPKGEIAIHWKKILVFLLLQILLL